MEQETNLKCRLGKLECVRKGSTQHINLRNSNTIKHSFSICLCTIICLHFLYYNPGLKIAFNNWRQVYLLQQIPVLLNPSIHRGALVYRLPGSKKRISYKKIKQGLVKQEISLPVELLPGKSKASVSIILGHQPQ